MILVFVFLRRFDLYLIAADILFLTVALLVLRAWQSKVDHSLESALRSKGI